jgi:N-acetylglucosamine-6-phosphate deacetylase
MFTHLGNGCPAEMPRHDNIIQRVLSIADQLRIGFIADGVHIPLFALKNYLTLAGLSNCFVVSDAMSAAGLGPGIYRLGRNEVAVGEDSAARSPDGSHLMGSAVTMMRSAALLSQIGFSSQQVRELTSVNPAKAIGL